MRSCVSPCEGEDAMKYMFVVWIGVCAFLSILISGPVADAIKVDPANMLHYFGIAFVMFGLLTSSPGADLESSIKGRLTAMFGALITLAPFFFADSLAAAAAVMLQLVGALGGALVIGREMFGLPDSRRPHFYVGSTWCSLVGAAALTLLLANWKNQENDLYTYAMGAAFLVYLLAFGLAKVPKRVALPSGPSTGAKIWKKKL